MNLQVRRSCVTVIRMNTNPNDTTKPDLKVIENGDPIDLEALEVLKAFLVDPLSDATGQLIDEHAARRAPRGRLTAV